MRNLLFVAMLIGATSCTAQNEDLSLEWQGERPEHLSSVISVEALMSYTTGTVTLDLWTPYVGYWVEPGLDHRDIEVICPSGQVMSLIDWLQEFEVSPGLLDDGMLMYSSGNASFLGEKAVPPCHSPCDLRPESDGTWECVGPVECGGF